MDSLRVLCTEGQSLTKENCALIEYEAQYTLENLIAECFFNFTKFEIGRYTPGKIPLRN